MESIQLLAGTVKDFDCIILDDMIDTGGTMMKCVDQLKLLGAKQVYVFVTHGLFNGDFYEQLQSNQSITRLYVTDSLPVKNQEKESKSKITRLSLAPLLKEYIGKL